MIDFKEKMNKEESNDLENDFSYEKNKQRRKTRFFMVITITALIILFGRIIISSPQTSQWLEENTFWGKIKYLTESSDRKLIGEKNDRINILLLGVGGYGHEGGQLADTIMLVSLKPSTQEAALISLPRDIVAPNNYSQSWRKINSINALAEARKTGSGGQATTQVISNILDTPIEYYLRLDFAGFVNIINELGGIEVEVENTLSDPFYPIEGEEDNPDYYARFQHLYIEKGPQKMDGSLALKFVRSRYAPGIEGSDFARGRRQQIVLEAIKKRLISLDMLLKPAMLTRIVSQLDNSIHTNLNIWEMFKLWEDYKNISSENISNHVFDDAPGGLLTASRGENGAFILLPRDGTFSEIKKYVNNVFGQEKITDQAELDKEEAIVSDYLAGVVVINGTWVTGLAANTADNLRQAGFNIIDIGNAPERDWSETLIYDLTYGRKNQALNKIKNLTEASLAYDAPPWLNDYRQSEVNFIILLGANN